MANREWKLPLEAETIQTIIPHRAPFLMIDRVIELDPGKRAVATKAVAGNEPHFAGHFPGYPVMPGVLMVEALAQVGCIAMLTTEDGEGKLGLFAGIDNVRFKRQVRPGDILRIETEIGSVRRNIGSASGTITIDGELACRGDILFAFVPRPEGM